MAHADLRIPPEVAGRSALEAAYREALRAARPSVVLTDVGRELEGLLETAGAPEWVPVLVREVMGKHVSAYRDKEREA